MLAPTPLSLLFAILLCLPLAIIFTLNTPITTPTTTIATVTSLPYTATATNITKKNSFLPSNNNITQTPQIKNQTSHNTTTNITQIPQIKNLTSHNTNTNIDAIDDKEDESLFEKASRVNPVPGPDKKLAFLFLTTSPLPFAPLWELFFPRASNLYNIYVHADPRLNYTLYFKGAFANRVIPSKPTRRHSPTLVSAARRLLAHALLHDDTNSMFALVSPSCIPLHSFNFTYATLINSSRSFVEILKNEPSAYERWAARGEDAMIPEVEYEDFRIGSQFWVVTRKHAKVIVSDKRLWSKFKLPCLRDATCYPDEHYFSTLLNMVDPGGCTPCTLTHVDWKGSRGGHPRTYVAGEVGSELIYKLRDERPRYGDEVVINASDLSVRNRSDPFLFARKFSGDTVHNLTSIANDVLFRD